MHTWLGIPTPRLHDLGLAHPELGVTDETRGIPPCVGFDSSPFSNTILLVYIRENKILVRVVEATVQSQKYPQTRTKHLESEPLSIQPPK